jgi:hypothetical protein
MCAWIELPRFGGHMSAARGKSTRVKDCKAARCCERLIPSIHHIGDLRQDDQSWRLVETAI